MKARRSVIGIAITSLCMACAGLAETEIPSLVGAWTVKSVGGVVIRGEQPGPFTHWTHQQSTLEAEVVFTEQKGRVVFGTFKSARAEEAFVAVIGAGNRFYFADQDGYLDGQILDADTIEVIYRHASQTDTVAAIGTWTRKP